ncbi:MAG: HGGxSTG domain-containing protein [Paracoccaceae bacterium]|nr:HGGxSTG domain-containing protein [Paracoccaceae bacterium]
MKFTKNNMVGFATRFGDQWGGVRCGAKTRSGSACQRPAYQVNGKCHLHGGASTGPRTEAGL